MPQLDIAKRAAESCSIVQLGYACVQIAKLAVPEKFTKKERFSEKMHCVQNNIMYSHKNLIFIPSLAFKSLKVIVTFRVCHWNYFDFSELEIWTWYGGSHENWNFYKMLDFKWIFLPSCERWWMGLAILISRMLLPV